MNANQIAEALTTAVTARRRLVEMVRRVPSNNPATRKAKRAAIEASEAYAKAAGITRQEAANRIQEEG